MNLAEMIESMTWAVKIVNIFMILMSIFSLYVVIERFMRFRKSSIQSYQYVLALKDHLGKKRVDDALKSARVHQGSSVARVMEAGLTAYKKAMDSIQNEGPAEIGDFDVVDSVNRSLERVKERETTDLRKGLGSLATIASTAPFIGLFGTVLGIIGAFQKLKESSGGGIDVVGGPISEALLATAVGLGVAIIAAMFFNYFTTRVENMVVDMNDVSSEFIDYVLQEERA